MSFGIMFHHFHGRGFPKMQGSISTSDFIKILKYLKNNYNLLNPQDFHKKIQYGKLSKKDTCLTFDDCLKSQIKFALPVLQKFKIKAFFFIYTSIFNSKFDKFEAHRDFRSTYYKSLDHFYNDFFKLVKKDFPLDHKKFSKKFTNQYLKKFGFYSLNDRKYRYYRDIVLTKINHDKILKKMMIKKKYNLSSRKKKIIMNKIDIKKILGEGHEIGLHSHSHPVKIETFKYTEQFKEYHKNNKILSQICKKKITSMSHPCGRYNKDTFKILNKLDIKFGFRSNMHKTKIKSFYEIPRVDHVDILKKLNKQKDYAKR